MKLTIAAMTAGFFLALALAPAAVWADSPGSATAQSLEQFLVANADTPAEHKALARYYRTRAADAKEQAAEHRSMAQEYQGKPGQKQNMRKHCERIANLNDELAEQYESLAKGEDAAAGK